MQDCPKDIWRSGKIMAMLASIASEIMETYVEILRKESGIEKIDWHWAGGRALVRALASKEELEKLDKIMFWGFDPPNQLRHMPCGSRGDYYPGGENHWSKHPEDGIFIVAAIREMQEEKEKEKKDGTEPKQST